MLSISTGRNDRYIAATEFFSHRFSNIKKFYSCASPNIKHADSLLSEKQLNGFDNLLNGNKVSRTI